MKISDLNKDWLYYLASPYSTPDANQIFKITGLECGLGDEDLRKYRRRDVEIVATELHKNDRHCIEPIVSSHDKKLGSGYKDWRKRDEKYMDKCEAMLIACLPFWEHSVGVREEIKYMRKQGKPIYLLKINFDYKECIREVEEYEGK